MNAVIAGSLTDGPLGGCVSQHLIGGFFKTVGLDQELQVLLFVHGERVQIVGDWYSPARLAILTILLVRNVHARLDNMGIDRIVQKRLVSHNFP